MPVSTDPSPGVTNRGHFDYGLNPGATQPDAVVVSNLSEAARQVTVYAANAFTTQTGQIGVKANDREKNGPVKWLKFTTKLGDGNLIIASKTSATIPFVITVPPDAPPGDYTFAIGAVDIPTAPPKTTGKTTIQIAKAVAVLVEIHIAGPLSPIVRVASLKVRAEPKMIPGAIAGSTTVVFDVVNAGNQQLSTTIRLTERNAFGSVIHTEPDVKLEKLLPGARVTLRRSWANNAYVKGSVTLDVTSNTDAKVTRSLNFWSVSWRSFVVPVVGAMAVIAIVWFIRRRRRANRSPQTVEARPNGATQRNSIPAVDRDRVGADQS